MVPGSIMLAAARSGVVAVLDLAALLAALSAIGGSMYGSWRGVRRAYRSWKRRLLADLHDRVDTAEALVRHGVYQVDAVMARIGTRDGDIPTRQPEREDY